MAVTQNETARYSLKIAGTEYTQSDPKGLESLVVEDGLDIIGKCDATFSGQSGTTWSSIKSGDDVEVTFGGSTFKVFKGVVTSLRHGFQHGRDTLTVTAMDPLAKLAASRQTSSDFKDMTDSDVVNKVMGGAEVEIGLVDATPETRQYHLQRNESALEILRRYAARNPAYIVRANEGKVDFCKLQLSDPPIEIPINQLMSLDYNQSPRGLPESMAVRGWDYLTKSMVEGKATASDLQAIGGGTIAPSSAPIWKAGETAYITDQWVDTQQSAKDAATAQFFWTALQFLRGKAVVQGNGSLHAGVRVKFANHQSGFNPDAVVMSSRHRVFVGSGFTTEIVFASNTYADGG
ncbi:MAG: contractile injection system protein, VgrG/Pvc8 family, partial [Myxococcota bacterium]